jgi:two-component system, NtrC family, sensor histidine kinase HydH
LVVLGIAQPLRRLTAAVQRISASGRLEMPDDLPVGGEVGVLASAFRRMMGSVTDAQTELVAQSRLAALGEIAANVAHEVRTPLSVLKTSAQLLGRPGLPQEEQRQLAGMLSSEVDRLNRVVTDLVDLGRPRTPRYEPVSMRAVVDRAVRFFAATAERCHVTIAAPVSLDPLTVVGSRDQLHQVLVNLLHNALQAMPAGGRLTVTTARDGAAVVVSVADTGAGFPAAVLAQVFTRFVTTKAGGTGLGLAISKRLIEEHRGRIDASNVATGGARVTVWLPSAEEDA